VVANTLRFGLHMVLQLDAHTAGYAMVGPLVRGLARFFKRAPIESRLALLVRYMHIPSSTLLDSHYAVRTLVFAWASV
jgi:hypothetical protein